jgi:hypothetical protein
MGPMSFLVQILGPKMCYAPTKSWMVCKLCFEKFLPSFMLEAVEPPDPILGPLTQFWAPLTLDLGSGLKLRG